MCLYHISTIELVQRNLPIKAYKIFDIENKKALIPWLFENKLTIRYGPKAKTNEWVKDWKTSKYWHKFYTKGFHAFMYKKDADRQCEQFNSGDELLTTIVRTVLLAGVITTGISGESKSYCATDIMVLKE